MGRGEVLSQSSPSVATTLVVMFLLLSAVSFEFSDASRDLTRELTGKAASQCSGKKYIPECRLCDAKCCASAKPCFTPLGCRPGDCD